MGLLSTLLALAAVGLVAGAVVADNGSADSGGRHRAPDPGEVASAKRPLVFPLRLKPGLGNASRSLLGSATLPLRGSVQEHGYYYAEVLIGTPPNNFHVIIDTGSTLTYVPCADCQQCGTHTNPYYDPAKSATHASIACNSADCFTNRCSLGTCGYRRSYAEHSSSDGRLIKDKFQLGGQVGGIDVVFGCEEKETGEIKSQKADGIMGLGNGVVSVPIQLSRSGLIEKVFSLCYGSFDGGGLLAFGRLPESKRPTMTYTDLVSNTLHRTYYTVRTTMWTVGGTDMASFVGKSSLENDFASGFGTVMDSGTTFTYIPSGAFRAFKLAIENQVGSTLNKVDGPDPQYVDICYQGDGISRNNLVDHFPRLAIHFKGGASLDLPPANYLFIHGKIAGAFCLGVFDHGVTGTLLGGITVRNTMVEYDLEEHRIGVGVTDCTAVHDQNLPQGEAAVGVSSPPPAPSPGPDSAAAVIPAPPDGENVASQGNASDGNVAKDDALSPAPAPSPGAPGTGENVTADGVEGKGDATGGAVGPVGIVVLLISSGAFGGYLYWRYRNKLPGGSQANQYRNMAQMEALDTDDVEMTIPVSSGGDHERGLRGGRPRERSPGRRTAED